jgi:hypothetical protein
MAMSTLTCAPDAESSNASATCSRGRVAEMKSTARMAPCCRRAIDSRGTVALIDRGAARYSCAARRMHSEVAGELGEGDAESIVDWHVDGQFIVAAAQVLHEGMSSRNSAQRAEPFQSAHRP